MQPCIRIYYSTVHWRLNMFRAAYRSSSGALTVFAASGLHMHVVTGHSQVWVGTSVPTQTWLRPITTCICKPEAANTELLMMSGVPLETCWAFNEWWNNKFCYKVASCWLFLPNIVSKKKKILHVTYFHFLSELQGNSVCNFDFSEVHNFC
jgi:hypothetical protein